MEGFQVDFAAFRVHPDKVLEARAEELKWCDKIGLFTKV